jgi:hypothetical protein
MLTVAGIALAPPARAQTVTEDPPETAPPPPEGDSGPTGKESSVGYIDSALPFSHFRLRFDSAYRNRRPTRAEFFYARARDPGLPFVETNVDVQDVSGYLEVATSPRFSWFVETPFRFLNPDVNANSAGLGDLTAGFKFAFVDTCDWTWTFLFKTYVPTGDADRGLGTHHVSLEPGLLFNHRLAEQLTLEGEFRTWVPVDGTDFAGTVVRYGLGLGYGQRNPDGFWLIPVVEFVGWTALDGKQTVARSPTVFEVQDAAGETIVNGKFGARFGFGDRLDFYAGYGRALTGPTWYKDIFRVEFRLLF